MKQYLLAAAIGITSVTSHAWGEREQGALTGLIIGTIIHQINSQPKPQLNPPVLPQQLVCGYNVYCQPIPQPPVCRHYPQYDYYGRITHYTTICSAN